MRHSDSRLTQNWTHYVRTAGHGVSLDRVDDIIGSATDTHVYGIEIDNSLTGYYESFLDPSAKLETIRAFVNRAHEAGHFVYIYTEGLETITSGADKKEHTFFKDHPDWVQRDISGRPAVFDGGAAFWIAPGDEDVWITPYAAEWRKIYMERIRQLAATGIDGVYIDIPYWMTHFDGWEETWASFDDYTVAAFQRETGLEAKRDIALGDFQDPAFIQWVDFRIRTLTEFMKEVDEHVKAANPQCKTIAEIYPGIEEAAVRVGSDVYDMYPVVDVIAHEYSGGGGNAARKNPLNWFHYMIGMYSFRAFAQGKASWMLSYSWDGEKNIDPRDAMKNLFMAQLMAGTNCWDARGHVMSGSNDYATRKEVYSWIARHEKTFYLPREPVQPIGIYFSPRSRNYFVDQFIPSYRGWMALLLHSHLEFQIVTPRTLASFGGRVLILPEVRCLDSGELEELRSYRDSGGGLIISGESGSCNENREIRAINPIHDLLGLKGSEKKVITQEGLSSIYFPECPGRTYTRLLEEGFNRDASGAKAEKNVYYQFLIDITGEIQSVFEHTPVLSVSASPYVSTQVACVDNRIHLFVANFQSLKGLTRANQTPERNMTVSFSDSLGGSVFYLPFLGDIREIPTQRQMDQIRCTLPPVERGAVIWIEK
jgi:hypothetical protein